MSKQFWLSKTFWANVAAIAAILLQYATDTEVVDAEFQAMALAVLNVLLRFVTNGPVTLRGDQ